MLNLLFICDQNLNRSKTAETIYSNRQNVQVRSAGMSPNALHFVTNEDIEWTDMIIVFEERQEKILYKYFSQQIKGKKIINLSIEDYYFYMDDVLIQLIRYRMIENGINV